MDPARELEIRLTDFANKIKDFQPEMIDYIQSLYSGDHGKGKLCFGAKLVIRLKNEEQNHVSVYPLGDIKCKKDKGEIFKESILDTLKPGIN